VIINLTTGGAAPTTTTAPATTTTTPTTATTTPTTNTTDPAITSTATSTTGPEIVLNIGGGSAGSTPEEITLSFNNTSSGEQLTIGVGSQQNPNTQQVTLNLPQNGSEQIILNLLNNSSATSSSSASSPASASSGVNVVA
jgi:hypothetical protein